ncbi:B3 DNA binding domain containing protein [Parasponia andersonii]|uniref:B3 DNA binding domain containing protein n=1 Tax=Parasponia andersonii TaxID=3476 RepID=A0A2P5DEU2_PARAD|nr:B3 DNA binding domain containing protein [Parasponia andersonii]
MAFSCGNGETQQPVFSATTPHFFTTVLDADKLQIPENFERICGETLSKDVVVRFPCGSEWKMGLSAVEVDYPYTPVQFHEPDIGGQEDKESKGTQTEESASVEVLEDFSFSLENQSPLSSSSRLKRRKTSNSGDEMKGDGDKSTTQRQRKYDVLKMMKPLCPGEKDKALKMTTGFKSKSPFFKVVMQPSYIMSSRLKIPPRFARKYLNDKSGRVNLNVSGGKTWSVTFTFSVYGKNRTAKFYNGWKVFAQANNLDIGDVCVFVLTKGSKVSFEVTIFRANEIARSPTDEGGGIDTSSNSDSDDETCILGSPDLPTKQASGGISSLQECPTKEGFKGEEH